MLLRPFLTQDPCHEYALRFIEHTHLAAASHDVSRSDLVHQRRAGLTHD